MGSLLSRLVIGAGVATAVMLGDPASAPAQPAGGAPAPAADAQKKDAAKKLVDQAIAAQGEGDYDKAIDLYRQAFALVPHPILMFNVGQAHRLAGRPAQAAQFYERYLTLDPSGKEAAAARAHLEKIKASGVTPATDAIGGDGGTGDTGASATEPDPAAGDAPTTGEADPAKQRPEPDEPRTDTMERPGRGLRITGLVLGGAGLVSLAAGGYFTTRVLALEDEATEATKSGLPTDQIEQDGNAAERNQDIAYILAGCLIVGGAATYYFGHRQGRATPTTAFAPVVRPDYAGFVLSGSLP
jgi:tetratricopeptide (TPR) repeat protein